MQMDPLALDRESSQEVPYYMSTPHVDQLDSHVPLVVVVWA